MELGQSIIDLFNHQVRIQDLIILLGLKWILTEAVKEVKRIIKEKNEH